MTKTNNKTGGHLLILPAHWSLKMGPIINNQNRSVYLSVVWTLGAITIISLVGIIGLSVIDKEIPQALIALGSVAVCGEILICI
jgi:hypothetical protein